MRIGIEGKVLTPKIGGIGRCAINLVRALLAISPDVHPPIEFTIFTAPQTDQNVLEGLRADFCDRFRGIKSTLLRSSFLLPAGLLLEEIDVFHGLDQCGIPFFFKKGKYVVTLHDVTAAIMPRAFSLKDQLLLRGAFSCIRRQADLVIVPSEAVREDVAWHLKMHRQRIIVIPWGCEERFSPFGDAQHFERMSRRYGLPERYVLFLSTLEPRKNATTLLQAFSLLRKEKFSQGLKLVIAGGKGRDSERLFRMVDTMGLRDDVIFTGFIEEEHLPDLYRGAILFVYPSLYEGFGLPIIEAMACGTPVIASNTSAMPEVAGGAALLAEPTKPDTLALAMGSVLTDTELREGLRRKGLARVRDFSWDTVARKTLEVYLALGAHSHAV